MKVLKKIGRTIVIVLLAIIFIASIASIISSIGMREKGYAGAFGYSVAIVQTNSMSGTLEIGDIVIGKIIDADTVINVGDIVTYKKIINRQLITITHRVTDKIEDGMGGYLYQTWGDNRTYDYEGEESVCNDPDEGYRTQGEIVSVYTGKIEKAGKVVNFLKTPPGYLTLAIPIALYIIYELFVLISVFVNNKKEMMLEETKEAKDAIIREYLASQQKNTETAEQVPTEQDPKPDDSPSEEA